jgi:hypothetical protein
MAGKRPAAWPWALVLAVAVAGCLQPSAEPGGPTVSSGPPAGSSSAQGSTGTSTATATPLPSRLVVTVELDRSAIDPGEVATVSARVENLGPGPFDRGASCFDSWSIRLEGPQGRVAGFGPANRCPLSATTSGQRTPDDSAKLLAGQSETRTYTWDGRLPGLEGFNGRNDAPPGAYAVTVGFGNASATANLTLDVAPTLVVTLANATAQRGEGAWARAVLANPTSEPIFYATDCAGAPWEAELWAGIYGNGGGNATAPAEPVLGGCAGPGTGRLDPGQDVEQEFHWNGTMYNPGAKAWVEPYGYLFFHVKAVYGPTPEEAWSRSSAAWSSVLNVP